MVVLLLACLLACLLLLSSPLRLLELHPTDTVVNNMSREAATAVVPQARATWRQFLSKVHAQLWRSSKLSYGVGLLLVAGAVVRLLTAIWRRLVRQRRLRRDHAVCHSSAVSAPAEGATGEGNAAPVFSGDRLLVPQTSSGVDEEAEDRRYVRAVEAERWQALRDAVRQCAMRAPAELWAGDPRGARQIFRSMVKGAVLDDFLVHNNRDSPSGEADKSTVIGPLDQEDVEVGTTAWSALLAAEAEELAALGRCPVQGMPSQSQPTGGSGGGGDNGDSSDGGDTVGGGGGFADSNDDHPLVDADMRHDEGDSSGPHARDSYEFPLPAQRVLELSLDLAHFPAQRARVVSGVAVACAAMCAEVRTFILRAADLDKNSVAHDSSIGNDEPAPSCSLPATAPSPTGGVMASSVAFPESFACLTEAQDELCDFEQSMEEVVAALGLVASRRLREPRQRVQLYSAELRRRLQKFRWTVLQQFGVILWSQKVQLGLMLCSSSLALVAGLAHAAKDQTRVRLLDTLSSLALAPVGTGPDASHSAIAGTKAPSATAALVSAGVRRLLQMEALALVLEVVREKADEFGRSHLKRFMQVRACGGSAVTFHIPEYRVCFLSHLLGCARRHNDPCTRRRNMLALSGQLFLVAGTCIFASVGAGLVVFRRPRSERVRSATLRRSFQACGRHARSNATSGRYLLRNSHAQCRDSSARRLVVHGSPKDTKENDKKSENARLTNKSSRTLTILNSFSYFLYLCNRS